MTGRGRASHIIQMDVEGFDKGHFFVQAWTGRKQPFTLWGGGEVWVFASRLKQVEAFLRAQTGVKVRVLV